MKPPVSFGWSAGRNSSRLPVRTKAASAEAEQNDQGTMTGKAAKRLWRGWVIMVFAVAGLSGMAKADCPLCPKSVTLSDDLARCYLQRVTDVIAQAEKLGLPVAMFDLTDCPVERARRGIALPEPRRSADADLVPRINTRFVLDAGRAQCLEARLRSDLLTIAEFRHYVFEQDCPDE